MTAHTELHGDEADLFAEHHDALLRSIKRAVNAPEALIEDACQLAWTQLIRTQPDRGPRLSGWLRTVAIQEAYDSRAPSGATLRSRSSLRPRPTAAPPPTAGKR